VPKPSGWWTEKPNSRGIAVLTGQQIPGRPTRVAVGLVLPLTHLEVRYRMHEGNVQRAVQEARRKLGIAVLPHELRHGFATHSMANGVSPRAIQLAMGHKSLETTMGYLHADSLSVRSPLEVIMAGNPQPGQKPGENMSSARARRRTQSAFSHLA